MKVAILAGGRSSERDVSVSTAAVISGALTTAGHTVEVISIDQNGRWHRNGSGVTLSPGDGLLGCDVVFPALHGPFGEDGTVQGLLELLDVPYVGAEPVPWARPGAAHTRAFEDTVAWLPNRWPSRRPRLLPVGWRSVAQIVERVVADQLDEDRLEGLVCVGVDETSYRRHLAT